MDVFNILFVIHAALFLATAAYAALLERHPGYAPDWTWATVVGGNSIIIGALALLAWLTPFVPWPVVLIDITLNCAAGVPIIWWQRRQTRQRAAERAAAKERKR